jgi:RNase P subunit RPR2
MKLKVRLFGKNYFISGSKYQYKVNIEDYYSVLVICNNCKNITVVYIKKGVRLNDIITSVKCDNCECRLEKREKL